MSIAQLEAAVGIDLLPSLSQRQKEAMLRLPDIKRKKAAYLLRL
jgi:endonuclease G